MQTPKKKTPVSKCTELAVYSSQMMSKFPDNTVLAGLSQRMANGGKALEESQAGYGVAVKAILPTRVELKYVNLISDRRIRQTQRNAEGADGKKGGAIESHLFPDGSSPIVRLFGAAQVQAMRDLEGRLNVSVWNGAQAEKKDVTALRERYEEGVKSRAAAQQNAKDAREKRDAEKQKFILTYAEIASRVAAEFPGDKEMQDLFFDDVRTPSLAVEADSDEADTGEELATEPKDPLAKDPPEK